MIEINLLEKKKPIELPVILGVDLNKVNKKSLVIAYVLYYVMTSYLVPNFKNQNKDIQDQIVQQRATYNKLKKEVDSYGSLTEVMDAFTKRIEELKSREALVAQVMSKKSNPYKVLRGLSGSLNDDIWFNTLTIDDEKVIKIEGESISFSSVGDFINNVKELEYFIPRNGFSSETFGMKELKEIQDQLYGENVTLQSFSIEGKVQSYGDL
ncbi:fimbrial assembly protein PilN [Bacteriovorax sp. BAL6_X]|uniref:PilN domain-containing protein n=1 Tax=Bacteriovorax sp. BAL6_X TaxID=1201290 RepID=UPI000385BA89|nr:PilN domain-containing protein [Bacteriovorax sp. BAL6_X]EPZ50597.1 fimbrial assembly protein PilN [Bacteriovorax sp. BAL6_X]